MKLTKTILKNMIRQVIVEQKEQPSERLSTASVDDQIDSLLIKFEKDSIGSTIQEINSLKDFALFLFEQDEPDKDEPADEEADKDKVTDSEEVTADSPSSPMQPELNLDEFTSRVARLVVNYDKLLDIQTVIISRAKNYISENYGNEIADKLVSQLEIHHRVYPTGQGPDVPAPPPAVRSMSKPE